MGLVQQPWACGDGAIGASGYCGLIIYDLNFVENTRSSRELNAAVLRL
jgi:nitrate reductase beta subunit